MADVQTQLAQALEGMLNSIEDYQKGKASEAAEAALAAYRQAQGQPIEVLANLAQAVQSFRKWPGLERLSRLRASTEFCNLVLAWEDARAFLEGEQGDALAEAQGKLAQSLELIAEETNDPGARECAEEALADYRKHSPVKVRRVIGEIVNEWGDPEAFAERSCEITGSINDLPFGTKVYVDVPAKESTGEKA